MAADGQIKAKLRAMRTTYILEAAQEVLLARGYRDASMDEIADRAGIAKGTLYQHFPCKEDLILALFELHLALFEQTVEEAAQADLPARARLEQILRYMYQDQRGAYAMLQLLTLNVEIRKSLKKEKEQVFQRFAQNTTRIREILEEGKRDGSLDPSLATGLMFSAFMNALTMGRPKPSFALEELSQEELISQIMRILFAGLSAK